MKTHLFLLLSICPGVMAQAPTSTIRPALEVQGAMLAFSVPDLDASAKWYTEKLGLRVVHLYPRSPDVHARAALFQGGGLIIELVQEDQAVDPGPERRRGLDKAGLVVRDFDRVVATLRARGVEIVSTYARRPDQPANVTIRDNAGNMIVLHEGFASFNDPLIGLVQLDPVDILVEDSEGRLENAARHGTPSCLRGRVTSSHEAGDTKVPSRGLAGVKVAVYAKGPSGVPMGDALASATSDASGRWSLAVKAPGTLLVTLVPPRSEGERYRGVFLECATSGDGSMLVAIPH